MAWTLVAAITVSVGHSVGQDNPPAAGEAPASEGDPAEKQLVVLGERHYWRKHYTFFPPAYVDDAAKPDPTRPTGSRPADGR